MTDVNKLSLVVVVIEVPQQAGELGLGDNSKQLREHLDCKLTLRDISALGTVVL